MEQSYLRFSIEESVWFKRGQEVSELISISLDPMVTVEEYEQYVTIRGVLELSGEYRMTEGGEGEAYTDLGAHRLIHYVETREDGISELSHRFPVDITIPKSRIQSLDDVYVTIDSFDYDIREQGQLVLLADIAIGGIYDSEVSVLNVKEESNKLESAYRNEEQNEQAANDEFSEEEEALFDPFEVVARKEEQEEQEEQTEQGQSETYKTTPMQVELKGRVEENKQVENEEDNSYNNTETDVKATKRKENELYLTKIFAKEQHQEFSRVKICIVQQGDSLDKIAERYDITVQQLLRVNQLGQETDIYEGQLLYIPVPAGSRT